MAWQLDAAPGLSDIRQSCPSSGLVAEQQVLPRWRSQPPCRVCSLSSSAGRGWGGLWQEMPREERGAAGSVEGDSEGGVLPSGQCETPDALRDLLADTALWEQQYLMQRGPGSSSADGMSQRSPRCSQISDQVLRDCQAVRLSPPKGLHVSGAARTFLQQRKRMNLWPRLSSENLKTCITSRP